MTLSTLNFHFCRTAANHFSLPEDALLNHLIDFLRHTLPPPTQNSTLSSWLKLPQPLLEKLEHTIDQLEESRRIAFELKRATELFVETLHPAVTENVDLYQQPLAHEFTQTIPSQESSRLPKNPSTPPEHEQEYEK